MVYALVGAFNATRAQTPTVLRSTHAATTEGQAARARTPKLARRAAHTADITFMEKIMKHAMLLLTLFSLSAVASASASAACNTSVVDVDLVTTVTVSAGAGETCSWSDNNANDSLLVMVQGSLLPLNLLSSHSRFSAESVSNDGSTKLKATASCDANPGACMNDDPSVTHVPGTTPNTRSCSVVNLPGPGAIVSTGICFFGRAR